MNSAIGSTFESFLEEENIKDVVESNAIKKIIALQMQEDSFADTFRAGNTAHPVAVISTHTQRRRKARMPFAPEYEE
ncbi:MAG: hypothetical protein LBG79_04560 [Spirochaetaceae bacterium]|jgi:hypothetical protein|nr:hypothetical protein [Spirochaetaceae bacterium]